VKHLQHVIKRPLITEKSTIEREEGNVITVAVDPRATKLEIKAAAETLFNVVVLDVRTSRFRGKVRRRGRDVGRTPLWKKARIKLRKGDDIEFFEGL
jgi:large subunit ribosomal protein L23